MYKTLSEKTDIFDQVIINTLNDLEDIINTYDNNPDLRFRGVSESKYTMLSSLQRACTTMKKCCQIDYIMTLLNCVKNSPDVISFFDKMGIAINDISCLSLMQHYGLPTPFIDFSTNIKIALLFAADEKNKKICDHETDEYASVYYFDIKKEIELGSPLQKMYSNGMKNGIHQHQDYMRQYPSDVVDISLLYNINELVKWEDIKDLELAFIEYQSLAPCVNMLSGQTLDISNPNLNQQKGCFVLNFYDSSMPLEDNWNGRSRKKRNEYWLHNSVDIKPFQFKGVMTIDKINCIDIKKKVLYQWALVNQNKLYDESQISLSTKKVLNDILTNVDSKFKMK